MGQDTKIEWASDTFNCWRGCTKVSEACRHCYAATQAKRNEKTLGVWGPTGTRVVASEAGWRAVERWNAQAMQAKQRRRVFCASMADVFEEWDGPMLDSQERRLFVAPSGVWRTEADLSPVHAEGWRPLTMDDVRERLFMLAYQCHWLDWLFLTKRPENIEPMLRRIRHKHHPREDWWSLQSRATRPNWWFGVTAETQEDADRRVPHLLRVPAVIRFLSCEPLLSSVDLSTLRAADGSGSRNALTGQFRMRCRGVNGHPDFEAVTTEPWLPRVHWVIAGGESGHDARPMCSDWARSLRDQCQAAGVPFFFKQWGEWCPDADVFGPDDANNLSVSTRRHLPREIPLLPMPCGKMARVGKKAAGRLLDGREWSELPHPFKEESR